MSDDLIGKILNDPEKMAQLSALADSLGLNGAASEPPPQPPAPERALADASFPDAAMLSALMGTLGELNRVDKRLEALLAALKAYLPPDGCRRLDRATELARLMRLMERMQGISPPERREGN